MAQETKFDFEVFRRLVEDEGVHPDDAAPRAGISAGSVFHLLRRRGLQLRCQKRFSIVPLPEAGLEPVGH